MVFNRLIVEKYNLFASAISGQMKANLVFLHAQIIDTVKQFISP